MVCKRMLRGSLFLGQGVPFMFPNSQAMNSYTPAQRRTCVCVLPRQIESVSRFLRRFRSDLTRSLLYLKNRVKCDLKRLKNRPFWRALGSSLLFFRALEPMAVWPTGFWGCGIFQKLATLERSSEHPSFNPRCWFFPLHKRFSKASKRYL